jgi:hypothetical protein
MSYPSLCHEFTNVSVPDYFTTTVQKIRQRKHQKLTQDASKSSKKEIYDNFTGVHQTLLDPTIMENTMNSAIEQDMDTFSSQEALDNQRAYYKARLPFWLSMRKSYRS